MTAAGTRPSSRGRSITAVLVGFLVVVVLSLGTDQVLHMLQVYPPWGEPMHDPQLNALALTYRIIYAIIGTYITAALAPHSPMRHVWISGFIGLGLATLGVVATSGMNLGPRWYPIALAATALPCAWIGGLLHRSRHPDRYRA
jgi:hypothetical protein